MITGDFNPLTTLALIADLYSEATRQTLRANQLEEELKAYKEEHPPEEPTPEEA